MRSCQSSDGDRVAHVVFPHARICRNWRAVPSSRRPSFSATRRLFCVPRHDRCFHAVQTERVEPVADHERDALGHVAVARVLLVDPVADEARLERAAQHASEAHLTDQGAVVQEQAESVGAVELPLALPRATPGAERVAVGDGIGRARARAAAPTARASHGCACGSRARLRSRRHRAAAASHAGRTSETSAAFSSTADLTGAKTTHRFVSVTRWPSPPLTTGSCGSTSR